MKKYSLILALMALVIGACGGSENEVPPAADGGAGRDLAVIADLGVTEGGSASDASSSLSALEPPAIDPASPLVFAVIGNIGSGNMYQEMVAQALAKVCVGQDSNGAQLSAEERAKIKVRNCQFVIGVGNNVDEHGTLDEDDPRLQESFFRLYSAMGLRFYLALGENDYDFEYFKSVDDQEPEGRAKRRAYTEHSLTFNDKINPGRQWFMPVGSLTSRQDYSDFSGVFYHFVDHPQRTLAHFFAVDTEGQEKRAEQFAQINKEILASKAIWKIVFGYQPWRDDTSATPSASGPYDDKLMCDEVDLHLGGAKPYLHHLAVQGCKSDIVLSGGGGSAYQPTAKPSGSPALGFAVIELDPLSMSVEFYDAYGQPIEGSACKRDKQGTVLAGCTQRKTLEIGTTPESPPPPGGTTGYNPCNPPARADPNSAYPSCRTHAKNQLGYGSAFVCRRYFLRAVYCKKTCDNFDQNGDPRFYCEI